MAQLISLLVRPSKWFFVAKIFLEAATISLWEDLRSEELVDFPAKANERTGPTICLHCSTARPAG
jgi:hypothetical protein